MSSRRVAATPGRFFSHDSSLAILLWRSFSRLNLWLRPLQVYAGVAIWLVEGWTNESDFPKKGMAAGMSAGLFKVMQSFFGANDHRMTPYTTAGRLMIFGLSFCILVMTSTYTAKLTVQGINDLQVTTVSTLAEAIQQQYDLCCLDAIADSLANRCDASAFEPRVGPAPAAGHRSTVRRIMANCAAGRNLRSVAPR